MDKTIISALSAVMALSCVAAQAEEFEDAGITVITENFKVEDVKKSGESADGKSLLIVRDQNEILVRRILSISPSSKLQTITITSSPIRFLFSVPRISTAFLQVLKLNRSVRTFTKSPFMITTSGSLLRMSSVIPRGYAVFPYPTITVSNLT